MFKKLYRFLFVDDLLAASSSSAPAKPEPLKKKLMRDLAGFTLFAYILLVFNPVMPLVADKMAHTFWLEYHLVTVHGVYGSAHVNTEMADNAKQSDNNKSQGNNKTTQDDYVHVLPASSFDFMAVHFVNKSYSSYKVTYPVLYPDIQYQPPKA